ncbi:MAG: tetratricopeptide repeat protein [Candidatus Aenigmarchaeota archaeon]|nr:tetratricopeptide repeat protein [Candidatus Aenigmarchaeota archaeon]
MIGSRIEMLLRLDAVTDYSLEGDASVFVEQIKDARIKREYENMLGLCDKALEILPDDPYLLNDKGIALKNLEHYQEAMQCYERAMKLKPDFYQAMTNKGAVLSILNRDEEGIEWINNALEIDPECIAAYSNGVIPLDRSGRYAEAEKYLFKAFKDYLDGLCGF